MEDFIINVFWIFGIKAIFSPGMIFEKAGDWIDRKLGWYAKPLIGCVTCMASVHGTAYYVFVYQGDIYYLVYIIALAGVNYIIANILPW